MAAFDNIPGYTSLKSYILEPGTKIYKGDNQKFFDQYLLLPKNTVTLTRGPAFFAITPEVAETYGVAFEFEIKERLFILNLDDKDTVGKLRENAPEDIKHIIEHNYGFGSNKRNSEHAADRAFSQYLCEKGLNGYVLEHAKTDLGGTFHPEIMLCDMSKLKFVRIVRERSPVEIDALKQQMRIDELNKQSKEKRQKNKHRSRRLTEGDHTTSPQSKYSSPTRKLTSSSKAHHSPSKQLFYSPPRTPTKTLFSTP
jgi:hypothetical protein